jgi:cytochrome c biogenesis protein CcmG, thiol:disulfide interchange protein DsbE
MNQSAQSSTRNAVTSPGNPNRSRTIFLAVLAFIIGAGVVTVLSSRGGSADSSGAHKVDAAEITVSGAPLPQAAASDPAIGQVAPVLAGTSTTGEALSTAPKPGRRLMIVGVAHWCPHCQREVPVLVKWAQDGKVPADLDVVFLSTAMDKAAPNYPPSAWLNAENVTFPVLVDDAASAGMTALGSAGFPNMQLFDDQGKLIARTGGELSAEQLQAFVEQGAAL